MKIASGLGIVILTSIASLGGPLVGRGQTPAAQPIVRNTLASEKTEEGQTVVFDAFTWRRRELAKRLPIGEPWPAEAKIGAAFKRFGLDVAPMPEEIPTPSRILGDIYLVNTEPNLAYLVDAGAGQLVLIDPGVERNVESILLKVAALGFSPKDIKWVINTHSHFDHAMADAHFQRLGAKILIGRDDVYAVEKGTEVTAKFALPFTESAHYPTAHVDWPVDDGERIVLGNKTFLAIHTPGHTDGSTCFELQMSGKTVLFGGDTVLFDYRMGQQASPFANDVAYLESLKKLEKVGGFFRWEVLLPGHGTIVLDRANLDVMKARREVQIDLVAGAAVQALPFATDDYRKMMFGRP